MGDRRDLLRDSLAAIERLQARLEVSERALHQPIAIIGAGCRYPGGVKTPEDLWRVLRDGVDAVSEVPADRWDVDAYYNKDAKVPGKMVTRRGGFLDEVDGFDPQFFGISPREAMTMDPQQRLLLETANEALESAGLASGSLKGSATGVFVGITTSDYGQLLRAGGPENSDIYAATGTALNAAAGRLSFTFDFRGPCVAIDAACASSLVAVHLACQSLRMGESDLALAGGVNVILSPDAAVLFSKWGMMAPDGACKTFDASANGFVRSEGCAVIALKRLADARAAGDPVLAVIRGSAVNSDGRSSGLTVPNGPAQEMVLKKALASAGLTPMDIDYVEAHGTGTSLGDPIEVGALGAVMCQGRPADRPLRIGSVKTNFGHTEAAAGVAGLLKVVMALRHECIPPHLHFSNPSPAIPWEQFSITVPTALTPWSRGDRPRRAGVSSFGFSGTNAHVVVEEAPTPPERPAEEETVSCLVPLSAHDEGTLRTVAQKLADALSADLTPTLADVATTTAIGRSHLTRRVALLAESRSGLEGDLRLLAGGQLPAGAAEGTIRAGQRPKIAFLFTGQGSQYAGMGRRLYETEPVFSSALDEAAAILEDHLRRPLLESIFTKNGSNLTQTEFVQPALFAIEYALTELWRSWGITPSIVMGHSVGEYVAACVAGVFTLEQALTLIADRARLMQELPAGGAMAAVFADEATVTGHLTEFADRLAIAALNGPEEIVVSGDAGALKAFLARLKHDGIKSSLLEVSHAFHSPLLDPMLDAFEKRARDVKYATPRIRLLSNLTGAPFAAGSFPDAHYWRRHAREPVRFASCVDTLRAEGITTLVEVGPQPTLLALAGRAAPDASWSTVASLRKGRDDRHEMLSGLAKLFVCGSTVHWEALTRGRSGRRVALPTYPFRRERYWATSGEIAQASARPGHPLLGERRELARAPGTYIWESEVNLKTHPWLEDHRVEGTVIVPATAYMEIAMATAREIFGSAPVSIQQIENLKPMVLHDDDILLLQTVLVTEPDNVGRLEVHSCPKGKPGEPVTAARWTAHVTATISLIQSEPPGNGLATIDAAREQFTRGLPGKEFYALSAAKGNQWGPCFQGLDHVWIGDGEAVARVQVPYKLEHEVSRYQFHPAISDACGHALVAAVSINETGAGSHGAFVGSGVGETRFYQCPTGTTLWAHAKLRQPAEGETNIVVGDVKVYDSDGTPVSETRDARLWFFDEPLNDAVPADWYYKVRWHAQSRGGAGVRSAKAGPWLIFADSSGLAQRIAAERKASDSKTIIVVPGDQWSFSGERASIRPDEPGDYNRLLESIGKPAVVVHLWSMEATDRLPMDRAFAFGSGSLLQLLHALLAAKAKPQPRIWVVTREAQAVVEADKCDSPWNAALWGLGRTLSVENAEIWGGLIDVGRDRPIETATEQLIAEVSAGTSEDKIAFRGRQRYVARLERHRPSRNKTENFTPKADATYLITGGLGGIGLAIARWLVEQGARHLLLVGRTRLAARDIRSDADPDSAAGRRAAAVATLKSLGAEVETAAIDIAIEGQLEKCLERRRARCAPPIAGVFHAAGVLQFQPLGALDVASLRGALAAKMDGAWQLHRLFAEAPLDCFVLFSSSSALLNSPLLGGYAAGNAVLDALAHHRQALGLPALSINWGTWGEVGMAVEAGRTATGDMLKGAGVIDTSKGLAALRQLLEAGETQAAVMPIDWLEFSRAYPAFASDPLLQQMVVDVARDQGSELQGLSVRTIVEGSPEQRAAMVGGYLREQAARVLGMGISRFDDQLALSSYGFDSLMAVQLKNKIEADFGIIIPLIRFLHGPSVGELVPSICEELETNSIVQRSQNDGSVVWEEGSV
jgi:acyl transferase domain-containing protein/acyl carrier protein